jgi:hypothetical protein
MKIVEIAAVPLVSPDYRGMVPVRRKGFQRELEPGAW